MITCRNGIITPELKKGIITIFSEGIEINNGDYEIIDTEINIELPDGCILNTVTDFSDLERNLFITPVGTNPVYLRVQNLGKSPVKIDKGDPLVKLIMVYYVELSNDESRDIQFIEFEKTPSFEEWLKRNIETQRLRLIYKISDLYRKEFANILLEANSIYKNITEEYINYVINMSSDKITTTFKKIYAKEVPIENSDIEEINLYNQDLELPTISPPIIRRNSPVNRPPALYYLN